MLSLKEVRAVVHSKRLYAATSLLLIPGRRQEPVEHRLQLSDPPHLNGHAVCHLAVHTGRVGVVHMRVVAVYLA